MYVLCGEKDGEYGKLIAFWGVAPFIQQLSVPRFLECETSWARFLVLEMWLKQLAEFCDIVNSLIPIQDTKNPDAELPAAYLATKYC